MNEGVTYILTVTLMTGFFGGMCMALVGWLNSIKKSNDGMKRISRDLRRIEKEMQSMRKDISTIKSDMGDMAFSVEQQKQKPKNNPREEKKTANDLLKNLDIGNILSGVMGSLKK